MPKKGNTSNGSKTVQTWPQRPAIADFYKAVNRPIHVQHPTTAHSTTASADVSEEKERLDPTIIDFMHKQEAEKKYEMGQIAKGKHLVVEIEGDEEEQRTLSEPLPSEPTLRDMVLLEHQQSKAKCRSHMSK